MQIARKRLQLRCGIRFPPVSKLQFRGRLRQKTSISKIVVHRIATVTAHRLRGKQPIEREEIASSCMVLGTAFRKAQKQPLVTTMGSSSESANRHGGKCQKMSEGASSDSKVASSDSSSPTSERSEGASESSEGASESSEGQQQQQQQQRWRCDSLVTRSGGELSNVQPSTPRCQPWSSQRVYDTPLVRRTRRGGYVPNEGLKKDHESWQDGCQT